MLQLDAVGNPDVGSLDEIGGHPVGNFATEILISTTSCETELRYIFFFSGPNLWHVNVAQCRSILRAYMLGINMYLVSIITISMEKIVKEVDGFIRKCTKEGPW